TLLSSGEQHLRQFHHPHHRADHTFGRWVRKSAGLKISQKNGPAASLRALDSLAEFARGIFLTPPSLQTRAQRSWRLALGVAGILALSWDAKSAIESLLSARHDPLAFTA